VVEEQLSPASIRRLSWRRKALAKPGERHLASNKRDSTGRILDGDGQPKTLLDRWWSNQDTESPDSSSLTQNWEARWSKLSHNRGKYGESLVHILTVNQTNEHLILLLLLIHLFPMLVADQFMSLKLGGLSCLHLSIAYNNELLLGHLSGLRAAELACLLERRCVGSLFRWPLSDNQVNSPLDRPRSFWGRPCGWLKTLQWFSRSPKRAANLSGQVWPACRSSGEKAEQQSYWCDQMPHWPTANGHAHLLLFDRIQDRNSARIESLSGQQEVGAQVYKPIYLGETPLAWSVSFGSRSMYELLVSRGANQDSQDKNGNTCLHQLVINKQVGWIRFLVKCGANDGIENGDRLSAFLLACRLCNYDLFTEFLELSTVEFWSYSMICCSGYPLTNLDSLLASTQEGRTGGVGRKSAMLVVVESELSSDEQKAQLFSAPVVQKLLEEKWRIFARRLFYRELALSLLHLFLLTLSISLRPQVARTRADELSLGAQQSDASDSAGPAAWPPNWRAQALGAALAKALKNRRELVSWPPIGSHLHATKPYLIYNLQFAPSLPPSAIASLTRHKTLDITTNRPLKARNFAELATFAISSIQLIRFGREWRQHKNVKLQMVSRLCLLVCSCTRPAYLAGRNIFTFGRPIEICPSLSLPDKSWPVCSPGRSANKGQQSI